MNRLFIALTCAALFALTPANAHAGIDFGDVNVTGVVTPAGDKFIYEYTVTIVPNDTLTAPEGALEPEPTIAAPIVVSRFMLPFFDSGSDTIDLASIKTPEGWTATLTNMSTWNYNPALDPDVTANPNVYGIDPNLFINPPFVLVFDTTDPFTYGVGAHHLSLSGFNFLSDYGHANGPTVILAQEAFPALTDPSGVTVIIDPPIVLGPGHPNFVADIPAPAALPVGLVGMAMLAMRRRHRRIQ